MGMGVPCIIPESRLQNLLILSLHHILIAAENLRLALSLQRQHKILAANCLLGLRLRLFVLLAVPI